MPRMLPLFFCTLLFCIRSFYSSSCNTQTGTFASSGQDIFDGVINGSRTMNLFYKLWIPSQINTQSQFQNETIDTPILVLVHGSGPNDHNEEISPFATFRDIARGLCQNYDIMVFTYDKRSCGPTANPPCIHNSPPFCELYPNISSCINITNTTYNDFVGDAIAAVQYLSTFKYITPSNIIPTGHSQGASIVPQVADFLNLTTVIALMSTGIVII